VNAWIFTALVYQTVLKDVHLVATPVPKALEIIGRQYQTTLNTSPLFNNKVIVVEANQVSFDDVRDQIAKAVDGVWETKDGHWYLSQPPKLQEMEERRRQSFTEKMLQIMLEVRLKNIGSTARFTREFAEVTLAQTDSLNKSDSFNISPSTYSKPEDRLMTRFLKKFGIARIASVPSGHRVVFASKPNQMQLQIGFDFQEDLDQYLREEELWNQVVRMKRKSGDSEEASGSQSGTANSAGNVLFIVSSQNMGQINLTLVGLTSDNKTPIFEVNGNSIDGILSSLSSEDLSGTKSNDVQLSQESVEFQKFLMHEGFQATKKMPPGFLDLFSDPVSRDPLAYARSEYIAFEAKKRKKNFVALVDDSEIFRVDSNTMELLLSNKLAWLLDDFVIFDEKWIRIRPALWVNETFPRKELRRFIQEVKQSKIYGLDTRAQVAALGKEGLDMPDVDSLIGAFATTKDFVQADYEGLRTYGLMSSSEWAQAASLRGIPFSQLNPRLQQHIFNSCFYHRSSIRPVFSEKDNFDSFVFGEPTFLAPNGIPNDALFRTATNQMELIKQADEEVNGEITEGQVLTARQWGAMKYSLEHDPKEERFDFNLKAKLTRFVMQTTTFRLAINPRCLWENEVSRGEPIPSKPFTFENLPDDIKREFDAGYREAAQRKKDDGSGATGKTDPEIGTLIPRNAK
jgi:hypothetical protein